MSSLNHRSQMSQGIFLECRISQGRTEGSVHVVQSSPVMMLPDSPSPALLNIGIRESKHRLTLMPFN